MFAEKYLGEWSRGMFSGIVSGKCQDHMQNYKFLHVSVMTCADLVNTQTHTRTDSFRTAVLLAQPSKLIINVG